MIDIIIPSWHHPEYTAACFRAIDAHVLSDVRIIWVDNGSTPAERDEVMAAAAAQPFPVIPVFLPQNLGFVKATNVGLAVATGDYVLLLNNDCQLVDHALERMLDVFDEEPTVGLVGPRATGTTWQARVPGELNKAEYVVLPEGRMLAFFCTLIKRRVVEEIGYLSERYRMGYGDDDEYCHRAYKAGFRLALRTDITVIHEGHGSFPDLLGPAEMEQYKAENLRRLDEDLKT